MVGYVLLITGAIVLGGIVYSWLKTYTPRDSVDCPEGSSLFIKDIECAPHDLDPSVFQLNITLQNNGRFDLGGYFIRGATEPDQELATLVLTKDLDTSFHGLKLGNAVIVASGSQNPLAPNDELEHRYNLTQEIYSIEIVPMRFQEEDNKKHVVTCADAKLREDIMCSG